MVMTYRDGDPFPGKVGTTFGESIPAWPVGPRAADGAPNVVLIVLDDVGYAQLSPFGSDLDTPNFARLGQRGLRYRNFHTTAMCSPTRACLLTGRSQHTCGIGGITDLAMGFPGFNGRIPKSCGFISEVLRQAGWATYAVGKWHLAPSDELHAGASRDRWPLGQGFERYYGFIGAETNHWAPDLVHDNTIISPEFPPDYHMTVDLTDRAIAMVTDLRAPDPDKPFFMYFALGACHAPHHAPREYIDAYQGRFDEGWDVWRQRTHQRQMDEGIIPRGTPLSERPEWVQEWETLPPEEQRAYARMMEVFAGFLTHTDEQVGRFLDFLESSGELDNTIVILLSDNGASAEGGPNGTFNENFLFNGMPHDLATTMRLIDELGSPNSYGHYPWGWAFAGNTPFKRWKRETHEGGIGDPLIIAGPGVSRASESNVRSQYVHATDVGATILDLCGIEMPDVLNGVDQVPLAGTSFRASLTAPDAPEHRMTQYYEQFACRALYHEGWKAVTFHPQSIARYTANDNPLRPYDEDVWELYHVAEDTAETLDLAATYPDKLAELQAIWWREAHTYGALPLQADRAFATGRPHQIRERTRYVFHQGAAALPEEVAPNTKLRPHAILAAFALGFGEVASGVLIAQGGRFGGFSLWMRDNVVYFTYNFAGVESTTLRAGTALSAGSHTVSVELTPTGGLSMDAKLRVNGTVVASDAIPRTSLLRFALAGEGLCCGYDDGTPVGDYQSPFAFTGTIDEVIIDVSGDSFSDVAGEVARAWAAQ